ncbi:MAG: prolyl oligopeptidase family protein [Sandaracinaceae bacterium]
MEDSALVELNREARSGAVTEHLHGVEVEDPYRALEESSPLTDRWVDTQTHRTQRLLATWTDPEAAVRLDQVLSIGVLGGATPAGDRLFYSKRDAEREQPAYYVVEDGSPRETPVIDPGTYGPRAALDWAFPSPDGRYVAFGISQDGDERSSLRVVDVDTGEVLDDVIDHAKWCAVSWLRSGDGFYYRRYPRPDEPHYDAEHPDTYHLRLLFHRLGTDPASDPVVFEPSERTSFPSATLSEDGRWLAIMEARGWSESDVFLFDRGPRGDRRDVPDDEHPVVPVVRGVDSTFVGQVHHGRLFLLTNAEAPRYRIVAVDPEVAGDRSQWREVVPEGPGVIDAMAFIGDRLAVRLIEAFHSTIRVHHLDGRVERSLPLPARGEVGSLAGDEVTGRLALTFSSLVHPPTLMSWTPGQADVQEIDQVACDVDLSRFVLEQATVESADGTPINVHFVHRDDMRRDGRQRVVLTGYGGFNIALLPAFQRNALYWVERGGVYAVANLRGGGELGEDWHRAGNLESKERVFEDFEAVLRFFGGDSGISRPDRIAIAGGSNGGLLGGAMVTRAPEALGAAVGNVGLYDMLRYHRFPPAELWVSEYGSADDPEQFRWLHAYSPYHHVDAGRPIPPTLITTADHDTRVHWAHSTKFAARLQEAAGDDEPAVLFHMARDQGHGVGTRRSDAVARYQRTYTFIERFIGRPGT